MSFDEYNQRLCEERHRHIEEKFQTMGDNINNRLDKLENRFLAIITTLVFNLLGVIVTVIILILRDFV